MAKREVEKKFRLAPTVLKHLTTGAEFIGEKIKTDEYFDTLDWQLSRHDTFLRRRNGDWELKVGDNDSPTGMRHYDEVNDPGEIKEKLGLVEGGDLDEVLSAAGYRPFAKLRTTRRTYRREGFTIDVDRITYPQGDPYDVVEIELLDEDPKAAEAKINAFAEKIGLPDEPVRGKLQYYCERYVPDQFAVMVKHGHAV